MATWTSIDESTAPTWSGINESAAPTWSGIDELQRTATAGDAMGVLGLTYSGGEVISPDTTTWTNITEEA